MFSSSHAQVYNPIAKTESVIVLGNARFTVLTPSIIRLEYDEENNFSDKSTLIIVNRNLPEVDFTANEENNILTIKTSLITLTYKNDGKPFNRKNLTIDYIEGNQKVFWHPKLKNKGNLRGTQRTLDLYKGDRYMGLVKTKLEEGIISRDGWYVLDDSKSPEIEANGLVEEARSSGLIDWYFFGYGLNYKRALYEYIQIAGRIPLPPKYVFGVWWSKWWAYSDTELKALAEEFESENIPLDVMIIDMDWHITKKSQPGLFKNLKQGKGGLGMQNGWTGFTWEKKYFPQPKEFLTWCKEQHINTALNIHPNQGVMEIENAYVPFSKAMGMNPDKGAPIEYDIINQTFVKNYFDLLISPLLNDGVDFIWLDWQQWKETGIKGLNNTFYLNHLHFNYASTFSKRPLIYHRWGGLGSHRYPVGFSGDTFIDWKSLEFQPYFTSTASNVCYGYWGHDIGGFTPKLGPYIAKKVFKESYDNSQNYELMTRWVQWGAFSPIFKTHGSDIEEIERRIWKYPEPYASIMKTAIRMRYDLLPYIYTYARMAYDSGISLLRPLYYDYPEHDNSYEFKNEYFFGDQLLISPITEPSKNNLVQHKTWLPPGTWFLYQTSDSIPGNQIHTASYSLEEIPIFVKEGAIIVEQVKHTKANVPLDNLKITLYPGKKECTFNLYEDNGNDQGYLHGEYATTAIKHVVVADKQHEMTIAAAEGRFPEQLSKRDYTIYLLGVNSVARLIVNGNEKDFLLDSTGLRIELNAQSIHEGVSIEWVEN